MPVKGYVFFAMSDYARGQLQQEKPEWLPQVEGVTTELLAGPYDGVFIVEAPDLADFARISVNLIANSLAVRSTISCIVIRDYGSAPPTPEEGG